MHESTHPLFKKTLTPSAESGLMQAEVCHHANAFHQATTSLSVADATALRSRGGHNAITAISLLQPCCQCSDNPTLQNQHTICKELSSVGERHLSG